MSILYEILQRLGLVERQRPASKRIVRYAHPSHDPAWQAKQKTFKPAPAPPIYPVNKKHDEFHIQSFDDVFRDMGRVEELTIVCIRSCGEEGAKHSFINKYVLGKLCLSSESAEKRSKQSKYADKLKSIRNKLKQDGRIDYDRRKEVWTLPKPVKKRQSKNQSIQIGRELTQKEKAYFAAQGFQNGDEWRKINDEYEAIQWLLDNYTPLQFENFCNAILRAHNVNIRITQKHPVSGADGGFDGEGTYEIDGVVHPVALQAKRYALNGQVGYDHCARFAGGLVLRGWKYGFIMTTGTFSDKSWECATQYAERGISLELIDQNKLIEIMLWKTVDPHGFGLHKTPDLDLVYINQNILKRAGGLS